MGVRCRFLGSFVWRKHYYLSKESAKSKSCVMTHPV